MDGTITLKGGGRMTVREEGALVHVQAERPDDGKGLYKVWLCGLGGKELLGTLMPERGRLYLYRRMSRSSLERAGCWPVKGGECVMTFPFRQEKPAVQWRPVDDLSRLVKEQELVQAAQKAKLLCKRWNEGFCLAGRFDTCTPFPIPTLFCFARVGELYGKSYVFFTFDQEGMPILPHKPEESGENRTIT